MAPTFSQGLVLSRILIFFFFFTKMLNTKSSKLITPIQLKREKNKKKNYFQRITLKANSVYKLICLSVCLYFRPSVCLSVWSLFEVPFKRFFCTHFPKYNLLFFFLEILNPWRKKQWKEVVSEFKSIAETTLPEGLETSGQRAYC